MAGTVYALSRLLAGVGGVLTSEPSGGLLVSKARRAFRRQRVPAAVITKGGGES